MGLLKRVFDFYIDSYMHVSIAAFCLTKITLLEFGITENTSPLFVLFATFISYNFIRYYDILKGLTPFVSWMKSHKIELFLLNLISYIFLVIFALKLRYEALFFLIPFALATIFYVVPFTSHNKNLRNISGLKLFLIAISWAGVTVLFPIINNEYLLTKDVWFVFFQRFVFLFAVTIPFDIRDLTYDIPELKTLPQTIGLKKSKLLGSAFLLIFFISDFFRFSIFENSVTITSILTILSFVLLNIVNENRSKYYTSFWIEAIPLFWYLLIILIK